MELCCNGCEFVNVCTGETVIDIIAEIHDIFAIKMAYLNAIVVSHFYC